MRILGAVLAIGLAVGLALPTAGWAGDYHHYRNSSEPNLYHTPRGMDGLWDLGVDITQAGTTPESVRAFMAQQTPRVQEILTTACHYRMAYPTGHLPPILNFCRIVVGL